MGKLIAALVATVVLLAACAQDIPATATDLSAAGFWKKRLTRDLPRGSSPAAVEAYLRSHGAADVVLSADRRTLRAAEAIDMKRYWPPVDLKSVQIECSFDASSGLEACSVASSPKSCCGK